MPKMILVKSSTSSLPGQLLPSVADEYDGSSDMVTLQHPVNVDGELTMKVPKALCYEFDPDAMELVNALVINAMDKLDAANKYMGMKLTPVEFRFQGSGDVPAIINH